MVEFFETYGADIAACIVALTSAASTITLFFKNLALNKKFKLLEKQTANDIKVTQDGIVNAFKVAKIPNELKLSISNQVDAKLEAWAAKFLTMFEEHEKIRTELAVANAKILSFTAAYNKLSREEQTKIDELIKQVTDKDKTIEVG